MRRNQNASMYSYDSQMKIMGLSDRINGCRTKDMLIFYVRNPLSKGVLSSNLAIPI